MFLKSFRIPCLAGIVLVLIESRQITLLSHRIWDLPFIYLHWMVIWMFLQGHLVQCQMQTAGSYLTWKEPIRMCSQKETQRVNICSKLLGVLIAQSEEPSIISIILWHLHQLLDCRIRTPFISIVGAHLAGFSCSFSVREGVHSVL